MIRKTIMSKLSSPRPPARTWFEVLPPTLFFGSGSVLLASVRFRYAERILRYRGPLAAFRATNALGRIGATCWRHRQEANSLNHPQHGP